MSKIQTRAGYADDLFEKILVAIVKAKKDFADGRCTLRLKVHQRKIYDITVAIDKVLDEQIKVQEITP